MSINKSLLTAALLGVVSAALSGVAFAADNSSTFCKPGFYAGVQGGRSDTYYASDDLLVQAANEDAGTNISTTYGYNTSTGEITSTNIDGIYAYNRLTGQKVDDIGIGGRIYAGYQFNPYFALEAGYTQYAKTDFSATGNTSSVETGSLISGQSNFTLDTKYRTSVTNYQGEVTEHAIDLVAKGTLPLQYGFGLYAKAGMAYIAADRHVNSNEAPGSSTLQVVNGNIDTSTAVPTPVNSAQTTTNGINKQGTLYTKSYQAFRPVAGVGINYTIPTTNISLDASYTRVFSYGAIPNASLLALGAEYKFA